MDLLNKRIEKTREKLNIAQSESTSNKQSYEFRSFRLTLEQELVIKGNLSEMYVMYIYVYVCVHYTYCNLINC